MSNAVPAFIETLEKPEELRNLMRNATAQNRQDVYQAAFRRLCTLEGMQYEDPLHRDFYAVLTAYEELLTDKNGRTTKATRTRQKLARHGVEKCLEDWANADALTQGFSMLVAGGMPELTAEYLVIKYADRFPTEAVHSAKARLRQG